MNRLVGFGLFCLPAFFAYAACQGPDAFYRPADGVNPSGGISGSLGGHGVGGTTGFGGTTGLGGATGTGGRTGTGGASGLGGATGTGGRTGTGGVTGTGGRTGTGGGPGGGGVTGSGGATGAGGRTGGTDGGGIACITAIQNGGYAFAGASPCSACMENGNSLATRCMMMIDCLGNTCPIPPGNCKTMCLNSVGGSGPLSDCVNVLLTAASCSL